MNNKSIPIFIEKEAQEVYVTDIFIYYGSFCEVLYVKEVIGEALEFELLLLTKSSTLESFKHLSVDQLIHSNRVHKVFNKKDKLYVFRYE